MAEQRRTFGDSLVNLGVITADQLEKALREQKRGEERLEEVILRLNFAGQDPVFQCLADYFHLPFVDLSTYQIDENLVKLVSEEVVRRCTLIPLFKIGNTLTVALANPLDLPALDEVRNRTKLDVEIVIASEEKIKKAINQLYSLTSGTVENILQQFADGNGSEPSAESSEYRKTHDLTAQSLLPGQIENAPVAAVFDLILIRAIRDRASDIHIEPDDKVLRIRFRIDGFLFESLVLPKQIHPFLSSRIKILAEMDITETRLPHDGNFNVVLENRNFEIRVSTFPTIYGENVVLRILDHTNASFKLADLGFADDFLHRYQQLIRRPSGIILVTGPTGSGKTTTLYATMNMINSMERNLITIEDPVEYRLPLIRQTQVNLKYGITFATGLRSILRQDPDVIMVGEIRDAETAEVAIQAALTGHLVLSTLHTNDAPEAVTRLMDIGVEPYLIASSVIGVLAQRLIRTICPDCRTPYQIDPKENGLREDFHEAEGPVTLYRGKGCKSCRQSGYWGRKGIFEFFVVNERIKAMISSKAPSPQIREAAMETTGMISLRQDGISKALKGITTLEEVDRVAYRM